MSLEIHRGGQPYITSTLTLLSHLASPLSLLNVCYMCMCVHLCAYESWYLLEEARRMSPIPCSWTNCCELLDMNAENLNWMFCKNSTCF